jgi:hypothetical protein
VATRVLRNDVGEQEEVLRHLVSEVLGWTWVSIETDDSGPFVELGGGRRLVAFRKRELGTWQLGLATADGVVDVVVRDL